MPEILETFPVEERETKNGGLMIYRRYKIAYHFLAEDGSRVTAVVVGEASDTSDKATNKCLSIAYKYAMLQIFAIPTEDIEDPDRENAESDGKAKNFPKNPIEAHLERSALMGALGVLLTEKTPDGGAYFTEEEKSGYRERAKQTGPYPPGLAILEQMKAEIAEKLEQRKKDYGGKDE